MALPAIGTLRDVPADLRLWRQQLNRLVNRPQPARTPFNFQGAGNTTGALGILLSWDQVQEADGYEIQMSTTGDFSSAPVIATLTNPVATSFYDNTVTSGVKRYYRVRSTSGTQSQPQSVKGIWSAPISQTSGSGTTTYDNTSGSSGSGGWNGGGRGRLNVF